MIFFINCSNLRAGGGIQVADSILREIKSFHQHSFIVCLSPELGYLLPQLESFRNVKYCFIYSIKHKALVSLFGRCKILDRTVKNQSVDAVLTVFGPSLWIPRCPHLCGFARAQVLDTDSPYKSMVSIKSRLLFLIWRIAFYRCSDSFYTESPGISEQLKKMFPRKNVFTITNYYNQVFDSPSEWLPVNSFSPFNGTTILTISSNGAWKNLKILASIARIFKVLYPDHPIRFVLTLNKTDVDFISDDIRDCFVLLGKVNIRQCPYLYKGSSVMLLPSLLECFTAVYPEAMRMGVAILTTDLSFARALCGDAALYYSPLDAYDASSKLHELIVNDTLRAKLVLNGKKQLMLFDDYHLRVKKMIDLLESL